MKKLFVGNLSWKVTEETLKPLFEACGNVVSIKVIMDQYTGKSKGFGFVEMDSSEAAQKAISDLNDKPLLDRNLRVSLAQERERTPGGNMGMGGGGGDRGGDRDRNRKPRLGGGGGNGGGGGGMGNSSNSGPRSSYNRPR